MNEKKLEYVKLWLEKAEDDLIAYLTLSKAEKPLFAIAGFHLQQASEKFLKAFLEYHSIAFAKTHDVEYLLHLCSQIKPEFASVNTGNLTDYAVDLRYPGYIYESSEKELHDAFDATMQIKLLVVSVIVF